MAEPIRKPLHRSRPPHPHTQKRPHAVLVRSQLLPGTMDAETILPRPAPLRPALVPALPLRAVEPVYPPPAALAPPDEPLASPPISEERKSRGLLLTALALHLSVLLNAWLQPAPSLTQEDLLLSGAVLLSGGIMVVLGSLRRS